ncbi:hypothetical protein [Microbispora sp. H11081]|uniref:hypothetical protein n=1 Tax=Microbispora sp. H11081 TaxID=2729107 RepID=UPI00147484EB|nr:hypothetical protein [Microbispora sp. H11081]
MRRPIRLLSLAALTCAGLLASAPAYAGCGCDTPKTAVAKPTAALAADAGLDVGLGLGLGLGLGVGLDVGLDVNANANAGLGAGAGTMSCGAPRVVRACR